MGMALVLSGARLHKKTRTLVPVGLQVSDSELEQRRIAKSAKGWVPARPRPRKISTALKAYAKLVTSADKGAIRIVDL